MRNARAKGSRLEGKSIKWLIEDGARYVFRGKGQRRQKALPEGMAQVDLIALYPTWSDLVEVTVPSHRARARKRLQAMNPPSGWHRKVHVWPDEYRNPIVEVVTKRGE